MKAILVYWNSTFANYLD